MSNQFTLDLLDRDENLKEITTSRSFVFIGGNGCGKTRLGAWIEFQSKDKIKVHRISAQKSLSIPKAATITLIKEAEKDLIFGDKNVEIEKENNTIYRKGQRKWKSKPAVSASDDYNKLINYLFSEHLDKSNRYWNNSRKSNSQDKLSILPTKLYQVKEVWERIISHRQLVIGTLDIKTKILDGNEYDASEMSDGERVVFYLIGQCLAAPQDGIIIIDEPELHLHKSILLPLWTEIEQLRRDCLFIYLTHDLDFAASLVEAQKIWIKSYNGSTWDWELIENQEEVPENLLIQILGNRKPVVFVEGASTSYDISLYRLVLNNFLVIPLGSCEEVIKSTKAFRNNPQLHHLSIFGLIDRDRRVNREIELLKNKGIYTLEVSEVEHLFCVEEIIKFVSKQLKRNAEEDFQKVSREVFKCLERELENQISMRTESEIKFQLNNFDCHEQGLEKIEEKLSQLFDGINVEEIHRNNSDLFNDIIGNQNYKRLLKYYNRKSISEQLSSFLGLKSKELPNYILRLLPYEAGDEIKEILKPYFGEFSQHMQ